MNGKKILFYLLAVVLGGCIPVASLHCLYTDKDVIFEEKLLGTWVQDTNDSKTIWEFTRNDKEPNNVYKLIFTDDEGKKGSFNAVMVKLQDKLFLDAYPSEVPWELEDPNKMKWPYDSFFLIPAHTFIKVDSVEPQLKLRITMDDKIEELLKEYPGAIEHTMIEDRIILTAKTAQLQAFVLKYAEDERLFTDEIALDRKMTSK